MVHILITDRVMGMGQV